MSECDHMFGEGVVDHTLDIVRFTCNTCGDVDTIKVQILRDSENHPDGPVHGEKREIKGHEFDVLEEWELPSVD